MQHLTHTDSVQNFIEDTTYACGSLAESDGDEELAIPIDACLGRIKKLQAAGIALKNEELKLQASARRRQLSLRRVTDEFRSTDQTFLKSPEGRGAKAVFSQTTAAIFSLSQAKFDETMDGILARTKDREHPLPEKYREVAKRFVAALAAYRGVQARQAVNADGQSKNSKAMADAKDATIIEMHRLEGELKRLHPGDDDEIELAFRPHPSKKKQGDAQEQKNAQDKQSPKQRTGTDGAAGGSGNAGSTTGSTSGGSTTTAGDPGASGGTTGPDAADGSNPGAPGGSSGTPAPEKS